MFLLFSWLSNWICGVLFKYVPIQGFYAYSNHSPISRSWRVMVKPMPYLNHPQSPSILVGGWATPLKNMSSSVGMMTFPIYGKNPNVPNHQPDNWGKYVTNVQNNQPNNGKIRNIAKPPPSICCIFSQGFPSNGHPTFQRLGYGRGTKGM